MKELLSAAVFTLATMLSANAQDKLVLRNGTEFEVKIPEITSTEVRYKMWNNQNGPLRTISNSDIFVIQYENGMKEFFSEKVKNKEEKKRVDYTFKEIEDEKRPNRLDIGIYAQPTLSSMYLDTPSDLLIGIMLAGSLGVSADWYFTDKAKDTGFFHSAIGYSIEGGNFDSYNNQSYIFNYLTLDLGIGFSSTPQSIWGNFNFDNSVVLDFGIRLACKTYHKTYDSDEGTSFLVRQLKPVFRYGYYFEIGVKLTDNIQLYNNFCFMLPNMVDPDLWSNNVHYTTCNSLIGMKLVYQFHCLKNNNK